MWEPGLWCSVRNVSPAPALFGSLGGLNSARVAALGNTSLFAGQATQIIANHAGVAFAAPRTAFTGGAHHTGDFLRWLLWSVAVSFVVILAEIIYFKLVIGNLF